MRQSASYSRSSAMALASSVLPTPRRPNEQEHAEGPIGNRREAGHGHRETLTHGTHRCVLVEHATTAVRRSRADDHLAERSELAASGASSSEAIDREDLFETLSVHLSRLDAGSFGATRTSHRRASCAGESSASTATCSALSASRPAGADGADDEPGTSTSPVLIVCSNAGTVDSMTYTRVRTNTACEPASSSIVPSGNSALGRISPSVWSYSNRTSFHAHCKRSSRSIAASRGHH